MTRTSNQTRSTTALLPEGETTRTVTTWHNCYDDGWKGLITPASFAHPAKMAYGLLTRIIETGLERGYWCANDLIGDCFGGVGTTGIVGASRGLRVVSVELEPRFFALAKENFELHRRGWEAEGDPLPVIVQGDLRNFAAIVGEATAVVTSPLYAESFTGQQDTPEGTADSMRRRGHSEEAIAKACTPGSHTASLGYGTHPGNIGNLRSGELDSVITSPPYAQSVHDGNGIDESKITGNRPGPNTQAKCEGYGASDGQIGKLPEGAVDGVVTSPPFEQALSGGGISKAMRGEGNCKLTTKIPSNCYQPSEQGVSSGQIANETGETYWQAMKLVYEQVHIALKPGGIAAIVIKGYIKKGKYIDLPAQTAELLTALGFDVFEETHAMLVKEDKHPSLFGGDEVKKTERKSFFRRLHERKPGAVKIDWETVLWARRI